MAARRARESASYHHGDLRKELIDAATLLVREHGSAAFSLREAARKVGVDSAASYRHFRDRGEVLVAIAQEGFADLADRFAQIGAAGRTPRQARARLIAMGQIYLAFAQERHAEFRLMFGECGLPARDPRLRLPRVEVTPYDQMLAVSTEYLVEKSFPAADAGQLADELWAAAHGVTRLVIDGAMSADRAGLLLDRLIGTVLDGSSQDRARAPARSKKRA